MMQERYQCSPDEVRQMTSAQIKKTFAITDLMQKNKIEFIYSHYDRMIIGGAVPGNSPITLNSYEQLKSEYFLQRREMGIINIGGKGEIQADEKKYSLDKLDCLYLGAETKSVNFISDNQDDPAHFFILSAPAHRSYPNTLMPHSAATVAALGSSNTSNERSIYKYIHQDGIKSCQLVMGLTILKQGSVWNTMPAHTHNRRMEAYFYFDIEEEQRVFHLMGEPHETRHIVLGKNEGAISPPWSIHSGCGTSSYSFIWGMAGENQSFSDMDFIEIKNLQ
jgi:4-deoxy-L-threo-5-hexosulose-uronate ketol-isomerase